MSKQQKTPNTELPPEQSDSQTAIAEALRIAALNQPAHGEPVELQSVTGEQMTALIVGAFEDIGRAFTVEVSRTRDVVDSESGEVTGQETRVINRLGFFQRSVLGTIVWKLEKMAADMDDPKNVRGIPAQELQIRRTMERVSRDESLDGLLNQQIDWLEVLFEQRSCLANAIAAAKEGYELVVGQPYDKPTPAPVTTVEVAPATPLSAQDRAKARLAALTR